MRVRDVTRAPRTPDGYEPIVQETTRGDIEMRYYSAARATQAAIFVGGAGGGFDSPVRGSLYPRLCRELQEEGMAALRVRYRHPNRLPECVLDVLAGIGFLEASRVTALALVGHSFGGAVVIQAAAVSASVRTCVALSTQTYGADPVSRLAPRCSLLLAHGLDDEVLPPDCSVSVYEAANEPKRLLLKEGVRHGLEGWEELPHLVREWLGRELRR